MSEKGPGAETGLEAHLTPQPISSERNEWHHRSPDVSYDARVSDLTKLLFRNLCLTIVTFGIYRFWARVRFRRFLWDHVRLLGERFEYLGTVRELIIGWLIVIALLGPAALLYWILTSATPSSWWLEVCYYAFLFFLAQFAVYRARRYRLTRTAWRGIRFGLDGSGLRYAALAVGLTLVSLISQGLLRPWARAILLRYFVNHARIGSTPITLNVDPAWLFRHWWFVLLPLWLSGIVIWLQGDTLAALLGTLPDRGTSVLVEQQFLNELLILAAMVLPILAIFVLLYLRYRVVEFRHLVDGFCIGNTGFASALQVGTVYRIHFLGGALVLLIIALLVGVFIGALLVVGRVAADVGPVIPIIVFVCAIPFAIGLPGIAVIVLIDTAILRSVCHTLAVGNSAAMDQITQSSADAPEFGEGLIDALDVGGY